MQIFVPHGAIVAYKAESKNENFYKSHAEKLIHNLKLNKCIFIDDDNLKNEIKEIEKYKYDEVNLAKLIKKLEDKTRWLGGDEKAFTNEKKTRTFVD